MLALKLVMLIACATITVASERVPVNPSTDVTHALVETRLTTGSDMNVTCSACFQSISAIFEKGDNVLDYIAEGK